MKQDFKLNQDACSVNDLNPGCVQLWTLGQQEAVRRLSVKTRVEHKQPARYELIKGFSTRAARIAGNYARIYLEQETNGKPELKGRFYWTGLAAFASKQVMCALDYSSDTKLRYLLVPAPPLEMTKIFLGKGNFWLFQDIFVWHWFYINFPEQFDECVKARDLSKCDERFKAYFAKLPWFDEALPKIKNLVFNDYIILGFNLVRKIEATRNGSKRAEQQLAHLMAIAYHEQLKILQPLIYDSTTFKVLLESQALTEGYMGIPRRLAALGTECETKDPNLDIVMTKGKLYNPTDRMTFIGTIASAYHRRMQKNTKEMEQAITTIASWSERND
ncbi:hypothetical protein V2K56_08785 [Pseudomonas alliivorans]|nr:hypothetical protein [Pseudomonas alliivorans]MEE4801655.1 hypothetical protein [Pseudomonas alliivorans]